MIQTTYKLICDVCKKEIEIHGYTLQHTFSGLIVKDGCMPPFWFRIRDNEHVCSKECYEEYTKHNSINAVNDITYKY